MAKPQYSWAKFNGTIALESPIIPELFYSCGLKDVDPEYADNQSFIPDIYLYENVSFGNNKDGEIVIDKPVFLMYRTAAYVHFLLDSVSVFYGIKNFVSDLEPYFIDKHYHLASLSKFDTEWLALEKYDNPKKRILNPSRYKYTFKKVYDFDSVERKNTVSTMYHFPFFHLRNNLLPKFQTKENYFNKLYTSRIDSGHRSVKNIAKFEMFMADKGFSLIQLSNMHIEAQIELFYHADEIVSFSGSGLTNAVFCKEGANVVEINHSPDGYTYNTWAKICKSSGINYHSISFLGDKDDAYSYVDQINRGTDYIKGLFS